MNNYESGPARAALRRREAGLEQLILADLIEKLPTRSIGAGQFVIGDSKVRPRIGETFHRDEKMGIYLQLYNFGPDEKTQKPNGNIEYQIVRNGSNQMIFDVKQDVQGRSRRVGAAGDGREATAARKT